MKQPVMPGRLSGMAMACWKGRQIRVPMDASPDIDGRRNQAAGKRTGKAASTATFLLKCRTPVHATRPLQSSPRLLIVSMRHDKETDMNGYRLLILLAAIVITGCEALVFVGATALN